MANNDYVKIPVTPEVYERVKMLSKANGFGERGLGKQISSWAAQELPPCEHKKRSVEIEYFHTAADSLPGEKLMRAGWYCPTCKRVYAKAN
jgi:hypothetical protein